MLSIHFILTHFRIKIHFMSHLLFKLVLFVYIHDMSKYTGLPTKKETLKTIQDMTIQDMTIQDMTIQDMTIQDMTNPRYDDFKSGVFAFN